MKFEIGPEIFFPGLQFGAGEDDVGTELFDEHRVVGGKVGVYVGEGGGADDQEGGSVVEGDAFVHGGGGGGGGACVVGGEGGGDGGKERGGLGVVGWRDVAANGTVVGSDVEQADGEGEEVAEPRVEVGAHVVGLAGGEMHRYACGRQG